MTLSLADFEIDHRDHALAGAGGEQRRLVHDVGEIRAGEPRCAARDHPRIDVRPDPHLLHVHLQDLLAAKHIRVGHDDLTVEAAGPQQRRVEHVGAVGRRDQDDAFIGLEAVHLDQQLVERLLALVVAAAQPGAAMAADGVDLVDEHDARRVLLRLLEHVAHARRADADEHLDEVGPGDGEEGHIGLAGDRAGEQGLAGTGRADQQHPFGNAAAHLLEFLWVLQELHDLLKLLLGLVDPGDIIEGHPPLLLGQQARARFAEAHRLTAARLHLAHEKDPHADQQEHGEPGYEDAEQGRHAVVDRGGGDAHTTIAQAPHQPRVLGRVGTERAAVGEVPGDRIPLNRDVADASVLHLGEEVGEREVRLRPPSRGVLEQIEQRDQQQADDDPERQVLREVVHPRCLVARPTPPTPARLPALGWPPAAALPNISSRPAEAKASSSRPRRGTAPRPTATRD